MEYRSPTRPRLEQAVDTAIVRVEEGLYLNGEKKLIDSSGHDIIEGFEIKKAYLGPSSALSKY